jgi:hypothetical protein
MAIHVIFQVFDVVYPVGFQPFLFMVEALVYMFFTDAFVYESGDHQFLLDLVLLQDK